VAPPHNEAAGSSGRPRRWPWILLAILVLLVALSTWAVKQLPTWMRDKAGEELSRVLERPVSLEQLELGLFPPRAQIKGFRVLEKQGSRASFSFASLSTEIDWASVSKKYPIIKSLKITKPELALTRYADGQTSVDDLIKKFNDRPKSDKLAQFSIANIELERGAVQLEDDTVKSRHGISELNVKLPFLSSLVVDQEVWVKPALRFKLDDRLIEAQAESLPFDGTHRSRLKVNIEPFELAPWLAYWPKTAVVAPQKARLQSALNIDFAQTGKTQLLIAGSLKLVDVALKQALTTVVFDRMDIQAEGLVMDAFELRPLERQFKAQGIALTRPVVNLVRHSASAAKLMKPTVTAKEAPVQFDWKLGEVRVVEGQIAYQDPAFLPKALSVKLKGVNGVINGLSMDPASFTEVKASAQTDRGELVKVDARFSKNGGRSKLGWDLDKASLSDWWWLVEPYLVSAPKGGAITASGQVGFGGDRPASLEQVQANIGEFKLKSKSGLEWLKFASLKFSDLRLDLETRALGLKRVEAQKLQFIAKRNAQNELSLQELVPKVGPSVVPSVALSVSSELTPKPTTKSEHPSASAPWTLRLDELKLDRSLFALSDDLKGRDTDLKFEDLKLLVKNLQLNTGASFVSNTSVTRPSDSKTQASSIELGASLNQKGRIKLKGPLQLQPVKANLELDLKDINVLPFQAYFTSFLNALITQGEVGAQGKLAIDLASENPLQYLGAVEVQQFASVTKAGNEDLLKWKSLRLSSTQINTKPLKIDLGDIELDEFYSRLIISPTGRFNLQDLGAGKPESVAPSAESTLASTAATPSAPASPAPASSAPASSAPAAPAAEPAAPRSPNPSLQDPPLASDAGQPPVLPATTLTAGPPIDPPPVRIGKITLSKGNIDFSDFFVKPNYSANLTSMAGSITELTPEKAGQITLTGRIDGTGTLKIEGSINPLMRNLFLDLKADAADIDLPRLTPYSGKYIGYGIEKGKLSAKVAYRLENRQLKAENRVILDQLTFGDKVDSPSAMKLPILFAVALLKDRNGVIDIEMPIGGSLDDPKFSVSGLVLRMIGNLIVKVITSPFTLLASLGGGKQQELSKIEFESGNAALSKVAQEKLESVAKALTDRPALKLDLAGRASLADDGPMLKKRAFDRLLKAQKLRETLKGNVGTEAIDAVEITASEYPKYLAQAFQASSLPKPKNFIGMQKSVPAPEMEKALNDTVQIGDTEVLNLANRRAQALKDWLAETGKIATDRLYITAPKVDGAPRVELSLK
jgi:Domain of Unknown Function (DUF748)